MSKLDGKSQAWRDAADRLLEALARENKYIVGDMLVIFLESANYGLESYEPLGGVFKRAAKKGIISKVDRPTKQALWYSKIYKSELEDDRRTSEMAGALKARDVLNAEMGIDSRATGAYLIDRYHERWGNNSLGRLKK